MILDRHGEYEFNDVTVVITHWGVIRALTGAVAANGEVIAFDPQ